MPREKSAYEKIGPTGTFTKAFDLAKLPRAALAADDKLLADEIGIFFDSADLVDVQDAVTLLHEDDKELRDSYCWERFKSAMLRAVKRLKVALFLGAASASALPKVF